MEKWYTVTTSDSDVVLSSRVRLARNVRGYPFPCRMNDEQRQKLNEEIISVISNSDSKISSQLQCINAETLDDITAASLVERCVVSPEFICDRRNKILFLSKDETVGIEVGGRDHIRISVVLGGIALQEAYAVADGIDNILCDTLPIAFDEQLGYLTESPTDLGTGMHASVLLHLPAMERCGEISNTVESVSKIGLILSNAFDSEYKNNSSTYQLSNRITLGITEKSALDNLHAITLQLISRERVAREKLDKVAVEDAAYRALGILRGARKITNNELSNLLSEIKLGISLELIDNLQPSLIVALQVLTRDNMLQHKYGKLSAPEIEIKRAEMIRKALE